MRSVFLSCSTLFALLTMAASPAGAADNALIIGPNVTSPNANAVSLGVNNNVSAPAAVAVGSNNTASGTGSVAVGNGSAATATNSIAIGTGADATATNSVAIGAGSEATEADTVSVGSQTVQRRIVNVAAGVAATDAVNVGQMQVADAALQGQITSNSGTIAAVQAVNASQSAQIASVQAVNSAQAIDIADLKSGMGTLFDLRRADRRDMRQGIAASVAMSSAPMPSAPGRLSYSVNAATFRGEQAVGGSMMYRLNTASTMAVAAGFSYGGNGNNAVRVGVAGEF